MNYSDQQAMVNPVRGAGMGMSTEHAAAAVVIGSLIFLIMIRRGFRGIGVPGVGGLRLG